MLKHRLKAFASILKRRYVVVIFACFLSLFTAFISDALLLFRAAYFLIMAAVFGFLWTQLNSTRGITARFDTSTSVLTAGESLNITYSVENSSSFPRLWLEVSVASTIYSNPVQQIISLLPGRTKELSFSVSCPNRGLYALGPVNVTTWDPFRLLKHRKAYGDEKEIIVYPETEELPFFDIELGKDSISTRQRRLQDLLSSQMSGVRPYVAGDDFRRIHWPSTARMGNLMVKIPEPDISNQTWLVLDMQEEGFPSARDNIELLVKAAASVAKKLVEAGRSAGLIYYSGERHFVENSSDKHHLWSLLTEMALAQPMGRMPVYEVIRHEISVISSGLAVIVFSHRTDPELEPVIRHLKGQGVDCRLIQAEPPGHQDKEALYPLVAALRASRVKAYVITPGKPLSQGMRDHADLVSEGETAASK